MRVELIMGSSRGKKEKIHPSGGVTQKDGRLPRSRAYQRSKGRCGELR